MCTKRLDEIAAYQRAYYGTTLYECIMAVADVCDMDNDELDALEADFSFGPQSREVTLIKGNV